ncbi:MAG TPA: FtsQ-type POTRA domain-containing protein, partial [Ilumatobacteraceae bacterium]
AVVFIDDDAIDDALVPDASGVLGRGIEPRLRDRRIAVRRAEGRRRIKWVVLAGVVVAVVVAGLAVLGSPLFAVDEVDVTGAVYTDPDRLAAVVDDLEGTPVLLVDTEAAERALEAIPWVDEARVRTDFPNRATIDIRERAPQATYQGPDGRFRVIDREGRVLDVLDGQPIAYMLLTGPEALDLEPGQFAPTGYAAAAELVQALTGTVRGRVSSIEVTPDGSSLKLFLDNGMEVRFGAATDLLAKLVRLETVFAEAEATGATVIDVSTPEVTVQ